VGGGSTEFILGDSAHPVYRQSFPIGTVRLSERFPPADPPSSADWEKCRLSLEDMLHGQVRPALQVHLEALAPQTVRLVGTGGTTSILAAMERRLKHFDREQIEKAKLSREAVWGFQKMLWSLPLAERRNVPGLPPNRADVILFGVAVFALIMETFHFDEVRASTRGLRFAAVAQV
jgi:exopolyphosphatase / guanosine-5'-triphosphate,3'-diphosphate pyrophosphatase